MIAIPDILYGQPLSQLLLGMYIALFNSCLVVRKLRLKIYMIY